MEREIALKLKEAQERLVKLISPGQRAFNEAVEQTFKDYEPSVAMA